MSLSFYFDEHVADAVAKGLSLRGIDVLRAVDDGMDSASDVDLLERATNLGRILVTHDEDFTTIAATKQATFEFFSGILYCHQYRLTHGQLIAELVKHDLVFDYDSLRNTLTYLPKRS